MRTLLRGRREAIARHPRGQARTHKAVVTVLVINDIHTPTRNK